MKPLIWPRASQEEIEFGGKGGTMVSRFDNLFTVNSFGIYVLSRLRFMNTTVQHGFLQSEADGIGTTSLVYAAASYLAKLSNRTSVRTSESSSMCMWYSQPNCNVKLMGTICQVPHASFSRVSTRMKAPFWPYWEADMIDNIVAFFAKGQSVGIVQEFSSESSETGANHNWEYEKRKRCLHVDLDVPERYETIVPFDGMSTIEMAEDMWPYKRKE